MRALDAMGCDYFVIVEAAQFRDYAEKMDEKKLLILDAKFQDDYDTFDNLGSTKSKGPGPARNFAWSHSVTNGAAWHWVMDDNISAFYRLDKNIKTKVLTGTVFSAMEDFCARYENVMMAGPNYEMFVPRRQAHPPLTFNTRIYSCNLIRNRAPFRWRGRYNEDTDLSLRMLKAGFVTIQFNAFLQNKVATQRLKGGNTLEFYDKEGTLPKSQMQVAMHPDVSRLVKRFNRWHHYVDYRPFKKNKLILKPGVVIPDGPNEYGMKLVKTK